MRKYFDKKKEEKNVRIEVHPWKLGILQLDTSGIQMKSILVNTIQF